MVLSEWKLLVTNANMNEFGQVDSVYVACQVLAMDVWTCSIWTFAMKIALELCETSKDSTMGMVLKRGNHFKTQKHMDSNSVCSVIFSHCHKGTYWSKQQFHICDSFECIFYEYGRYFKSRNWSRLLESSFWQEQEVRLYLFSFRIVRP